MRAILSILLCFSAALAQIPMPGPGTVGSHTPAGTSPTYVSSNSGDTPNDVALSFTATTCTTGTNRIMLIALVLNAGSDMTITSATYAGANMNATLTATAWVQWVKVYTWYVVNPASAGAVSINYSGGSGTGKFATACYSGVNQTTPVRTPTAGSGSASPGTLNVTNSQTNDLIVGFFGIDDVAAASGMTAGNVGAGQTPRISAATNSTNEAAVSVSDEPGAAGTVVHSWGYTPGYGWGGIAIPLIGG